jgi:ABC-type phosphate/phosphonate transport system ATPase subunit
MVKEGEDLARRAADIVNVYSTELANKSTRRTLLHLQPQLQAEVLSAQEWINLIDINYNYTSR